MNKYDMTGWSVIFLLSENNCRLNCCTTEEKCPAIKVLYF
jgi:hypothetical protein